jgi:membrane-associated HD superfamily phosphohydrolase
MDRAVWFVLSLPWFYWTAALRTFNPPTANPVNLVPAIGLLCLAIGTIAGLRTRRRALLFFLVPIMLDQIAFAGFGLSSYSHRGLAASLAVLVLIAALGVMIVVAVRNRDLWAATLPLTIFNLIYGLFTAFMSLLFGLGPF